MIDIVLFRASGLSVQWSTVNAGELGLVALLVVWLNFYFVPGHPRESFAAEVVFVVGLMVLVTVLGSPMQYGAVAIGAPYADPWLAAADAAIGVPEKLRISTLASDA